MNRFAQIVMLSCKKTTELIEKKSFVGLSYKEEIQLRLHTCICDSCTNYKKQSVILDNIVHHLIHSDNQKDLPMNNILKEKIIQSISKK